MRGRQIFQYPRIPRRKPRCRNNRQTAIKYAKRVSKSRTVAVILAGGVGTRVGLSLPKQLIKIAGRPIIEHTIRAFSDCDLVDEIVVVMTPGYLDEVRSLARRGGYRKITHILEGGETRNASTASALSVIDDDGCKILFHDAVRPLVSQRIIRDCIDALESYGAVDTAIPSADTIIQVEPLGDIAEISDILVRSRLRRGQTPQGFRASIIKRAYAKAMSDPNFIATDDCTVVLRYQPDTPIAVVIGDELNMKVTEPVDLYLADKLFQLASSTVPRLDDTSLQSALKDKVIIVLGGSYGIGEAVATAARENGARVHTFSRSTTGTHVQRRNDIMEARDIVIAEEGLIDYVINTAGVLPRGPLVEASDDTVWSATEVNYLAPVLIAQEFHQALRESRGGLLLFTSSSYTRGRADYSLYSSAKAATVNLVQALADEWSEDGIRVNCINPERTATPMRMHAFGDEPPTTLLKPRDVAIACLETIASSMTGQVIDIRRSQEATFDA